MRRSWRFRVETSAFGLLFTRSIWLVQGFSSMREPIGSTVIDCSLLAAEGATSRQAICDWCLTSDMRADQARQ